FPPGPYWEQTPLDCCTPAWARSGNHPLGAAATHNVTVSVLWKVDLDQLKSRNYDKAFTYLTHLTDPERGDNRDVYPFPEKITINGRPRYLCLHRPWTPQSYGVGKGVTNPSMFLAAADTPEDLPTDLAIHHLLATGLF